MSRYSSSLADHFNSPRNVGQIDWPDAVGRASLEGRAPYVTIYVKRQGGRVSRATFQTFGCGYSIAACSALTEMITGKCTDECLAISAEQLIAALDGMPSEKEFCAQMAIDAMRDAVGKLVPSAGDEV